MSDMLQDIQIDLFLPDMKANNQRQILQILSRHVSALTASPADDLLRRLVEKEKSSTFAIGDGLALPNLQLKYLYKPFKALCSLKKPIDFQASDDRLVDLVCLILSPLHEGPLHLRRLARMSRLLKNPSLRRELRDVTDAQNMKSVLYASQDWTLAA